MVTFKGDVERPEDDHHDAADGRSQREHLAEDGTEAGEDAALKRQKKLDLGDAFLPHGARVFKQIVIVTFPVQMTTSRRQFFLLFLLSRLSRSPLSSFSHLFPEKRLFLIRCVILLFGLQKSASETSESRPSGNRLQKVERPSENSEEKRPKFSSASP